MTITWTNTTVRLGDLKPWQDNPRTSTKAQAKRILASFERYGQVAPIAIDPDCNVLDGHQRLSALLTVHGAGYEVEARQSSRPLTDDERRGLVLALANATGSWNWDSLSGWNTETLTEWGFDKDTLKGWNSDVTALGEFLKSEAPTQDAEPQTDRAAELLEKWGVQTGDLWLIGDHRLICGDCTDAATVARVMDGERADMVTDPPYGMDLDTDWSDLQGSLGSIGASNHTSGNKYEKVIGDDKPFEPAFLFELYKTDEMFLFGADYYCDKIPDREKGSWLVWDKRKPSQSEAIGAEFELVWSKRKHKRRMMRFDWFGFLSSSAPTEAKNRVHPTQKPTPLIEYIITEWCKQDVIIEPFSGSGTTMVACENLRRRCRAVEISPAYVAVALERMAQAFPHLDIRRAE